MRMKGQWSEQNKNDQEKRSQAIIRNWWDFPAASVVHPWKWRDSLKLQMLILLPFSKSISSNSPFSNPLESPPQPVLMSSFLHSLNCLTLPETLSNIKIPITETSHKASKNCLMTGVLFACSAGAWSNVLLFVYCWCSPNCKLMM